MHPVLHGALAFLKLAGVLLAAGFGYLAFLIAPVLVYLLFARIRKAIVGKKEPIPGSDTPRLRGLMRRMARQTLLLAPARVPGFSKLGGEPELPMGRPWPQGVNGPRAFVAQIDLAEVRAGDGAEWLPAEGRLYAFYDEWRAGFTDEVCIEFSAEPAGPPVAAPESLSLKWRFSERRVAFLPFRSAPSLDWLGVDLSELDVSESELDELAEAPDEPFGDELQHRIGGYPSEIQGGRMAVDCEYMARGIEAETGEPPPAILRASRTWRLLLQIDSDPGLGMAWGDGGRLYVFVREAHARRGDFSKTVTLSQCY